MSFRSSATPVPREGGIFHEICRIITSPPPLSSNVFRCTPGPSNTAKQLVRWNPLTGKVDGVDGANGLNRKNSSGGSSRISSAMSVDSDSERLQKEGSAGGKGSGGEGASAGAGGGGGDETDEGEDELEGVLERFEWYRRLFDFSGDIPPPESAGYGPDEDPDQNLVPQVCRDRCWFTCSGRKLTWECLWNGCALLQTQADIATRT